MPSPRNNPPVIEALIQATELAHNAEEFGMRLDALAADYAAAGQANDFEYCLLHWLRSGDLPGLEYRDEIVRRLGRVEPRDYEQVS